MLNLSDALLLYDLLSPYLPDEIDEDMLSLSDRILEKVVASGDATTYMQALSLLLGKPTEEIVKMKHPKVIKDFVVQLVREGFPSLVEFCKEIGL